MSEPSPMPRAPRFATRALVQVHELGVSQHEVHTVDNLSAGGLFVRTARPLRPGCQVWLRAFFDSQPVDFVANVVHNRAASDDGGEDGPGMGLRFEGLSIRTRKHLLHELLRLASLGRVIDDPMNVSQWQQVITSAEATTFTCCTTFVGDGRVWVFAPDRAALKLAWRQGLARKELFVASQHPPQLGDMWELELSTPDGALQLVAAVVHVVTPSVAAATGHPAGVSFNLLDLEGRKLRMLEQYLAGATAALGPAQAVPSTVQVALCWFLEQMAQGQHLLALGLSRGASTSLQLRRATALQRLFEKAHAGTGAPLDEELAAALRMLRVLAEELDRQQLQ